MTKMFNVKKLLAIICSILILSTNMPASAVGESGVGEFVQSNASTEVLSESQTPPVTETVVAPVEQGTTDNAGEASNQDVNERQSGETTTPSENGNLPPEAQNAQNTLAANTGREFAGVFRSSGLITPLGGGAGLDVNLRMVTLEGVNTTERTEFTNNENVVALADLTISGVGAPLIDPFIVLTIDKKTRNNSNIYSNLTFSDTATGYQTVKWNNADCYYAIYKFDQLTSGTVIQLPVSFLINSLAEDGDEIPVKVAIYDAENLPNKRNSADFNAITSLPLLYQAEKIYKIKRYEVKIDRARAFIDRRNEDGQLFIADSVTQPVANLRTLRINTSDNATHVDSFNILLGINLGGVPEAGQPSGSPAKSVEKMIVKMQLPHGITLDPNDRQNIGWSYDPVTGIATLDKDNPDKVNTSGGYFAGVRNIPKIQFTNYPFGQEFDIKIETQYRYPNEPNMTTLPELTLKGIFQPIRFTPTKENSFSKRVFNGSGTTKNNILYNITSGIYTYEDGRLFDNGYDQTANGLLYFYNIYNVNNGSSFDNRENGQTLNIFSIEDELNTRGQEHRTYYGKYTIGEIAPINYNNFPKVRADQIAQETIDNINTTPNVLYGITYDGQREVIASNLRYQQEVNINDTALKYKGLSLDFERPINLNNMKMAVYVQHFLSSDEKAKYDSNQYTTRQEYSSKISMKYTEGLNPSTDVNQATLVSERSRYGSANYIDSTNPRVYLSTTSGRRNIQYNKNGNIVPISIFPQVPLNYGPWGSLASEEIGNLKAIMLLPPGIEYYTRGGMNYYNYSPTVPSKAPEIIPDYKGTGKTALIFDVPPLTPVNNSKYRVNISFNIDIKPHTKKGENTIEYFLVYPDYNNKIKSISSSQVYTDILDLDDDGNTTEKFTKGGDFIINFLPPLEIMVTKQSGVKKELVSTSSIVDMGEKFYYEISINNNTITDIPGVTVIDTLPYPNDHYISPNNAGIYELRGSQFGVKMVSSIESIPENQQYLSMFDIYYQTTAPGADISSVKDGVWVSEADVTNFEDVRSIKFQTKAGQKVPKQKEIKFFIESKIPVDRSLIPANITGVYPSSTNTAALSLDNNVFVEGNKANTSFKAYELSGVFFKDYNNNAEQDATEDGIKGAEVSLFTVENGVESAVMENGSPVTTMTGSDGSYKFQVLKRGNYRVKFKNDTTNAFVTQSTTNPKSNHIESANGNMGTSKEAILSPLSSKQTRNGAIISNTRDIEIKKISNKIVDQLLIPIQNVKFELTSTDLSFARREAITNEEGIAIFKDLPFGTYTLTELETPSMYEIDPAEQSRTIVISPTSTISSLKLLIRNREVVRSIKLTKVDEDNPATKLPGVEFKLTEITTNPNPKTYTKTTESNGEIIFTNVGAGKYLLKETRTIAGYKAPTYEREVTIDQNTPETLDIGNITNKKVIRNIKLTKVDGDNNAIKLDGVVFSLLKDNVEIKTATTDSQGIARFENVGAGEYKIKEKTQKIGYVLNNQEISVTVQESSPNEINLGEVPNQIIKGSLKITKVDQDNPNIKLSGTTFELRKNGALVEVKQTDGQGVAEFRNIPYGDYQLVETVPKAGYVPNPTPRAIQIRTATEQAITITNKEIQGKIEITKLDQDTDQPIQNVEFTLYDQSGATIITKRDGSQYKALTNASGKVVFEKVPKGIYQIKETRHLPEYKQNNQAVQIEIQNPDEEKTTVIKNKKILKNIEIIKQDLETNENLQGVVFVLKKGTQELEEKTTGSDGKVIFENVGYGDYKIAEKTPKAGYKPNVQEIEVQIRENSDDVIRHIVKNKKIRGIFKVTKVDFDDPTIKLSGVEFELRKGTDLIDTKTTNSDGEIIFRDLLQGTYTLSEKTAKTGYERNTADETITINNDGDLIEKTIKNKAIYGKITINKVESTTNLPIENVEFGIFDDQDNPIMKNGQPWRVTTGSSGKAVFDRVPYGNYKVKETRTPSEYIADQTPLEIQITTQNQAEERTHRNEKIQRGIRVEKKDVDTNQPIENTVFELRKVVNNVVGQLVAEETTNAQGIAIFTNITTGDYRIIEKTPNPAYKASPAVTADVSIRANSSPVQTFTFTNEIKKGNLKIVKVDSQNANKKLKNAEFELKQGVNLISTHTTDQNGEILIQNLRYGDYILTEKKAPIGYEESTAAHQIEIRNDGVTVTKTITNERGSGIIKITKVDELDNSKKLQGVEFTLYDRDGQVIKDEQGNDRKEITDAQGIAKFENVVTGEYEVIETGTRPEYVLDNTPINITIANGQIVERIKTNKSITRDVTLTKVDFDNQTKTLQGVVFEIRRGNVVVDTQTTDSNGVITFRNISAGNYKIVEISTVEGYNLKADAIDLTIDQNSDQIIDIGEVTNKAVKGGIRILKVDSSDENIKIPYVIFELRKGNVVVNTRATNQNGILEFENIPYGDYQLVEILAPTEYLLNPTPINISIRDEQVQNLKITNDRLLQNKFIEIKKVDRDDITIPLKDVEYQIFESDGVTPILKNGAPWIEKTNIYGIARFRDILVGNYKIKEISAARGYILDPNPLDVRVLHNDFKVEIVHKNRKAPPIKADIKLTKVDENDQNIKLQGVEYTIYKEDGSPILKNGAPWTEETDNDGIAIFSQLEAGKYKIKETRAKDGYELDTNEILFTLDGIEVLYEKIHKNKKEAHKADIEITTVDRDDTNTKLDTPTYGIYNLDRTPVLKNGMPWVEQTLNKKVVFEGVPEGQYKIRQISTDTGYILNTNEIDITVGQNDRRIQKIHRNEKLPYNPYKSDIEITTVDKDNTNIKLNTPTYGIYNLDGTPVLKNGTPWVEQTLNKKVVFREVPEGQYKIKQISTDTGYILNTNEIDITIGQNDSTVQKTHKNEKVAPNPNPNPSPGGGSSGGGGGIPPKPIQPTEPNLIPSTNEGELPQALNYTDHFKYILGYPDKTVRPQRNITRAEVATIYYRLLKNGERDKLFTNQNKFSDMKMANWHNKAISSMSKGEYIKGYPDGTFRPDRAITRAEFVAITARFVKPQTSVAISFTDVKSNHWANEYIKTAIANQWVNGYPDGTFGADRPITRAEVVTIINRMLHRGVGEEGIQGLDYIKFKDNKVGSYYYYEMIEATNDHEYTGTRPNEKWSSLRTNHVYDVVKYEHP